MKPLPHLPDWDTLAGRVLDAFFAAVHDHMPGYDLPLTIFGSAPIQLCLDEAFTSADVDIMVLAGDVALRGIANQAGVGRSGSLRPAYGVQICPPQLFKPTPHYLQRAHVETRHGLKIIVPHLRDILIGKLHRSRHDDQTGLVPKDLRAFQRVRKLCGDHPTLAEFLEDLVSLEPVINFKKSCTPVRFQAISLGWNLRATSQEPPTPVMSATQSGSFASPACC